MSRSSILATIADSLRQWLFYPREFRIGESEYIELSESLEALAKWSECTASDSQTTSRNEQELLDMAADVGTLVWRVQQRLATTGEHTKQLQRLSRDIERTQDALTQGGIEIKDHTGGDYDGGMALRVITSQPVPSLARRQIIETLRPTIYYRDRIIQMGEVVVGVPEEAET